MQRLSAILILLLGTAQAAPPAVSRTRLCAEQDRDFLYVHNYDGNLNALNWTFGTADVIPWAGSVRETWWDGSYHGGMTLPTGTRPGTYKMDVGRGPEVDITVVAPPKRTPVNVAADAASFGHVKAAAATPGVKEIVLAPGDHYWPDVVALPDWTILRGSGAVIHRVFTTNLGTNWPLIVPGRDVTIRGVTFVYDQPGQVFLYLGNQTTNAQSGLVVADCTFKRCNFGFYFLEALIRDCTFEGGGSVIAPGGLWWRCQFRGPSMQHAWDYWATLGPVMQLDCSYFNVDRACEFNAAGGPISDFLSVGLTCDGVNSINGSEVGGVEGNGPFTRASYLHTSLRNCNGPLFQFDQVAFDILIRDLEIRGPGLGIMLWGRDVQRVRVEDFELQGPGIYCGAGTRDCTFANGTSIGFMPTRGNQPGRHPSKLCDARRIALWNEGAATNTLANVEAIALPAGFTASTGFTAK